MNAAIKLFFNYCELSMLARHHARFLGILILLSLSLTACAYEKVKPWHRDILALPHAQLVPDKLQNAADEHIYFSKEAASGGQGVGGGGCGCN